MTQTIDRAGAKAGHRTNPRTATTPPIPLDTLGGLPLDPWYGPEDSAVDVERDLGEPGAYPFTRGVHRTMYRDKVWTMRQFAGFGSAQDTNERYRFLLAQGQTGLSVAFDMPTLMGINSDSPHAHGRGRALRGCGRLRRGHAHALRRNRRGIGHHVDDHQLAGADPLRDVSRRRRRAGDSVPEARRHAAERHPQGIHRAEGVHLPDPAVDAPRHRRGGVLHAQRPELEPRLHQRVPHPRGREHRRAGARLHACRRLRVRGGRHRARARRRRVRAAPVVLLQRPYRLLRGDRQVPRCPAHLGAAHARAVRRQGRTLAQAAFPHADGGMLAHRAADREQRRAHRVRGARRRARRHQLAAHQLDGRGAGAADGESRADRAAHAADPRLRDRCAVGRRSARRLVVCRGPHEPHGAGGRGLFRRDRRARRDDRGRRRGIPAARDRRRGLPVPEPARDRRKSHCWRQRLRSERRHVPAANPRHRPRRRGVAGGEPQGVARDSRQHQRHNASRRVAGGRERHRQHDARDHRLRSRAGHRRARSSKRCARCSARIARPRSSDPFP